MSGSHQPPSETSEAPNGSDNYTSDVIPRNLSREPLALSVGDPPQAQTVSGDDHHSFLQFIRQLLSANQRIQATLERPGTTPTSADGQRGAAAAGADLPGALAISFSGPAPSASDTVPVTVPGPAAGVSVVGTGGPETPRRRVASGEPSAFPVGLEAGQGLAETDGEEISHVCLHPYFQAVDSIVVMIILAFVYILVYHMLEVVVIVCVVAWMFFSNRSIKRHVGAVQPWRRVSLLAIIVTAGILCFALYLGDTRRLEYLSFQVWDRDVQAGTVFRITLGNDATVVMMLMALKALFFLLCPKILPIRRQRRVFVAMEHASRVYRVLLPVPIWISFVMGITDAFSRNMFLMILILHFGSQTILVFYSLANVGKAIQSMLIAGPQYGKYAIQEDIEEHGDKCAICHDVFRDPVMLDCHHIFCEECLESWLAVRATCPMCRSAVRNASQMPFSNGSTNWVPNPV